METVNGRGLHSNIQFYAGPNPKPEVRYRLQQQLEEQFNFTRGGMRLDGNEYGMRKPTQRAGKFIYSLKGFDRNARLYLDDGGSLPLADVLGIEDRGPQGYIPVQRCGTSRNIAIAARKSAGWREIRDPGSLAAILHPDTSGLALEQVAEAMRRWLASSPITDITARAA